MFVAGNPSISCSRKASFVGHVNVVGLFLDACEEHKGAVGQSVEGFGKVLTNGCRWNIDSKKLVSASLCCRPSLRTERAGREGRGRPGGMAIA